MIQIVMRIQRMVRLRDEMEGMVQIRLSFYQSQLMSYFQFDYVLNHDFIHDMPFSLFYAFRVQFFQSVGMSFYGIYCDFVFFSAYSAFFLVQAFRFYIQKFLQAIIFHTYILSSNSVKAFALNGSLLPFKISVYRFLYNFLCVVRFFLKSLSFMFSLIRVAQYWTFLKGLVLLSGKGFYFHRQTGKCMKLLCHETRLKNLRMSLKLWLLMFR